MNKRLTTLILTIVTSCAWAVDYPDTEKDKNLPPVSEVVSHFQAPPGFNVSLFASEPSVLQPISMAFDEKGRLWVAECFTYAESAVNFETNLFDRLIVLEDANHDGQMDRRTVFSDRFKKLTSVEIGFGGVWVLCAPQLLFIPDKNGDMIPDGEPQVVLDGWNDKEVRHNIVNGLRWGPDGWLYGRHGILATSNVGAPGTPAEQRTKINCGIWRYHPTQKKFEVVAHGTTNPWGMDYDQNGEFFFINTVIGHLWHLIPGAHYRRMYGEDLIPNIYQVIEQHADHFHWDARRSWTESREAAGEHGEKGGGHAHSGMMIYQGDNWPEQYRNGLFTINLHGRRLNQDTLHRQGNGYVGKHGKDMFRTTDPWYRAVELASGPDGAVYLADWSDVGECHENDGVHRNSGRIYKFSHGRPGRPAYEDLSLLTDEKLIGLLTHSNEWYGRQSRRLLQERAHAGSLASGTRENLRREYRKSSNPQAQLRYLWALNSIGAADEKFLLGALQSPSENVRVWAIRFLTENKVSSETLGRLAILAGKDTSGLVRLYLASALQRVAADQVAALAKPLLNWSQDEKDHDQPLLLWYGIERLALTHPKELAELSLSPRFSTVRQFIARRLAQESDKNIDGLNHLLSLKPTIATHGWHLDILTGVHVAIAGWQKMSPPSQWPAFNASAKNLRDPKVSEKLTILGLIFGEASAVEAARKAASDPSTPAESRQAFLRALVEQRVTGLNDLLAQAIQDPVLHLAAARGLVTLSHPQAASLIIDSWSLTQPGDRAEIISSLSSRVNLARELLNAIGDKRIPRHALTAYHARQIQSLGQASLNQLMSEKWGTLGSVNSDKQGLVKKYASILSTGEKGEAGRGREVFKSHCGVCHKLYGEGGLVGPDLTGASRDDSGYLLEHILDPSGLVSADFRVSIVTLKDEQVLTGVITSQNERSIKLQGLNEPMSIERAEVQTITPSQLSLMPDGILEGMAEQEVRDLFRYLMQDAKK